MKFLFTLLLMSAALLLAGCGHKASPPPAVPAAASEPDRDSTPASAPAPAPLPAKSINADNQAAMLEELTQALRKYSAEHRMVPKSYEEFVAAGGLNMNYMPQPPAGKKFAIQTKGVQVILVNR